MAWFPPSRMPAPSAPKKPLAVIIGAGPAGLMAAETLAASGARVDIYERMPSPARKFLMAGRGGLNITHGETFGTFVTRYGAAQERLRPFLRRFTPDDVRAWCATLGEPTFTGSSGRVFPNSFKASPLLRRWLRRLAAQGVRLHTRQQWVGWDADGCLLFRDAGGSTATVAADACVLSLGGASWPRLGSVGDWITILAAAGIEVAPLQPANCGFAVAWSEYIRKRFAGTPLKRIEIAFGGLQVRGEAIISATGIEGGAIYALSAALRDAIAAGGPVGIAIDLKPDASPDDLARLLVAPRGARSLSTFLRKTLGLPPVAVALLREAEANGAADLTATSGLVQAIKALPVQLMAPNQLERAISSAGGIRWREIDEHLMLRSQPGCFVCGEMLDWEAPTGGYLLQACLATGRGAGAGAVHWLGLTPAEG